MVAIVTPETGCAVPANSAILAEIFTVTVVALFTALRTYFNAVFASCVTALANYSTVRAKHTAFTEANTIRCTVKAFATVNATVITVAYGAVT